MNLSPRTILQSVNHRTSEAVNVLKSRLELTQEVCEATEALAAAKVTSGALINMIDNLCDASRSLEACGYSTKWLETINADDKFLKVVNLDLANLCKSADEQTDAAMEGILSTIWDYIKKIWNFILDIFHKVVQFVKNLFSISKSDASTCQKAVALAKLVSGAKDEKEIMNEIGEAINELGGGGFPDMRQIIVRMSVILAITCELQRQYPDSTGVTAKPDTTTGQGFFDEAFIEYAVGANANRRSDLAGPKVNKIFADLLHSIEASPSAIVGRFNVNGFNGFKPVGNVNLHDAMRESGVSLGYSGEDIIFTIKQIEGHIPNVDYKAVYSDMSNYTDVCSGYKTTAENHQKMIAQLNKNIDVFTTLANEAKKFAVAHSTLMAKTINAAEHKRKYDAFTLFSKWTLEVTNSMTTLISAYSQTEVVFHKFITTFAKKVEEIKNRK